MIKQNFSRRTTLFIIALLLFYCHKKPTQPNSSDSLLNALQALPNINIIEIDPAYDFPRAFQIDMTQPVDHANPEGSTFTQRAYLLHRDVSKPMVFAPSGYAVSENSIQEIADILDANCLSVTHRYFEGAKPEPLDWQYLTIAQAASDHHRIVTLLKQVYKGIWLSSGKSKSGMTALFHRRFYPDDVDATIAYVAPILFDVKDPRLGEYIATLGDEVCRKRLKEYQKLLLKKRDALTLYFEGYFETEGLTLGMDKNSAFEYAVLEYPYFFWQYHHYDCSSIPDSSDSVEGLFAHFKNVVWLQTFSTSGKSFYEPWIYQALTELGYPAYVTDHLEDLLIHVKDPGAEFYGLENVTYTYKPDVMQDIQNWLQTEGNEIIFIYGGIDPWTGAAVELTGQTNAIKIIQDGEDHGVGVTDLDNPRIVLDALETWLGITIDENPPISKPTNIIDEVFL